MVAIHLLNVIFVFKNAINFQLQIKYKNFGFMSVEDLEKLERTLNILSNGSESVLYSKTLLDLSAMMF